MRHIIIFVLIIIFALSLQILVFNHISDDAFISFKYAHNLAKGKGLVFNPGEKVEGFSNILWIIILFIIEKLKFSQGPFGLLFPAKITGMIIGLLSVGFAYDLGKILSMEFNIKNPHIPFILPALLASALPFHFWAVSGLETPLVVLLLTLFLIKSYQAYFAPPGNKTHIEIWPPLLIFLISLLRPEGPILTIPLLIILIRKKDSVFNRFSPLIFFLALPYLVLIILRYIYYHDLLPNIFYTKAMGGVCQLLDGIRYFLIGIKNISPFIVTLTIVPFLFFEFKGYYAYIVWTGITYSIFILLVGGDFMIMSRFFVHIMPVIYSLTMLSIATIINLARVSIRNQNLLFQKIIIFLIVTLFFVIPPLFLYYKDLAKYGRQWTAPIQEFSTPYEEVITYIKSIKPKKTLVAVEQLGYFGYYTDWHIVDLQGLIDPWISHLPGKLHHKYDIDYVIQREPDFIVTNSGGPGAPIESNIYNKKFLENLDFRKKYFRSFLNDWFVVFKRIENIENNRLSE